MTYTLKDRETITGVVSVFTSVVDVSRMSQVVAALVVYALSGTGPTIVVRLQTSDDLETWVDVGTNFSGGVVGPQKAAFTAASDVYGRYVRFQIDSTGTNPLVNYSLYMSASPG